MLRLRVFDISSGPKSAVAVQASATSLLSDAYVAIRNALGLLCEIDQVTLHTVKDRHVDRAPLRTDFTLAELGLSEDSIIVVRRRNGAATAPSPTSNVHTVSMPDDVLERLLTPTLDPRPETNPSKLVPAPPTVAETPAPVPLPKATAPSVSSRTATHQAPQECAEQGVMTAPHNSQSALRESTTQQAARQHTVEHMRREQQRTEEQLREMSRATLTHQAERHAQLYLQYGKSSSTWLRRLVPGAPRPQPPSPSFSATRVQLLHREVLSQALAVVGNHCTTATALIDAFFEKDATLESVYTALKLTYPLLSSSSPSSFSMDAFTRFLRCEAPWLSEAASLIQYLYHDHMAEFADHVLCTLHGVPPCAGTWLHDSMANTWYSALSGLSQTSPPTWLLDPQSCSTIVDVQLPNEVPARCHSRCPRLGLDNPVRHHGDDLNSLDLLLAACCAALRRSDRIPSVELRASLSALARDKLIYLDSLITSDQRV